MSLFRRSPFNVAFLFSLLFSYLREPEENKRQHFILRRNVCHLLFEGKKSHMGKLDIISVSGLNRCGTGRIERFFWGCWKTSSQEWEVVRNYLPVFYILALPCFFYFLFFLRKQWLGRRHDQKFQKLFIPQLWNCCRNQTAQFLIMVVGNVAAEVWGNWFWQTAENNQQGRKTNSRDDVL